MDPPAVTGPTPSMLLLLLSIVLLTVGKLVSTAYFTPLKSVPGPWYAKFTSVPITLWILRGQRAQRIHHLHQVYGPVVRIAPNEVDVADLQGYHAIHKIGNGFRKSQWYPRFRTAYQNQDVFSETQPKTHAFRRKVLSRPFSKSNLRQHWEPLVRDYAWSAVSKIKSQAQEGVCDVFEWWTFYTLDVIGKIAFGVPFNLLELGRKTDMIKAFESAGLQGILRAEFPALYNVVFAISRPFGDVNAKEDTIIQYGSRVIDQAMEGTTDNTNIFANHLREKDESEDKLSRDGIVTEATGLIGAGGGTTAITLTYLIWACLSNPAIQKRLEDEVATLPTEFTDVDLEALPYMSAVIEETLRLYGPIPGTLSRIVPESGLQTCGHFIPPGTTVGTMSYSMHRKADIYARPELFDPERFLQHEYALTEQKTAFAAFGAGSRICLGMHLAYIELRIAVAFFFRECKGMRLAPSAPTDMDMVNFFGGAPRAHRCGITLAQS